MRRKSMCFVAVAIAVILAVAGCGSGNSRANEISRKVPTTREGPYGLIVKGSRTSLPEGYAKDLKTLVFGVSINMDDSASTQQEIQPAMRYLEQRTGLHVAIRQYMGFDALASGVMSGDVDIAWLSNISYGLVKSRGSFVTPVRTLATQDKQGESGQVIAISSAKNGISSLRQAAGKTVCFASSTDLVRYQAPIYMLKKADVSEIKRHVVAANENVLSQVGPGKQCALGFDALPVGASSQENVPSELAVIDTLDIKPGPLVVMDRLPSSRKAVLIDALRQMTSDSVSKAYPDIANTPAVVAEYEKSELVNSHTYDSLTSVCSVVRPESCDGDG